jgi:hypothetical protein
MNSLVLSFKDIDKTKLNLVGGKAQTLESFAGLTKLMFRMAFVSPQPQRIYLQLLLQDTSIPHTC